MNKFYKIGAVAVLAIVIICSIVTAYILQNFDAPEGCEDGVRIFIPANSDSEAIRDTLVANLGESYGCSVYRLWQWQGSNAEDANGSYVVMPGEGALKMSRRLKFGRQTPIKFTFQNIRKFETLADLVDSKFEMSKADFLNACDTILKAKNFKKAEFPAAFLPDSYEFYWNATPSKVVNTMLDVRNNFWNDNRRAKAKKLGLTPVEVATIASIVEEETAKYDERPQVARLYMNRVNKGMKLQADPTVKFAVGDFSIRRITGKYLDTNSPYNTYRVQGLPPGPIRIVESRTLDDVLNAEEHPYLYMCAREDFSGYHNFATDYATHMANARRYQAELNKRNIK